MIVRGRDLVPIDFEGRRILDHTAGLSGDASLATVELPPGASHRPARSRRSDKYYLVLAGTVRFTVDGDEHDLAAGDLCLVRRGRRFRYRNPSATPARLALVHTPPFAPEDDEFVDG